MQVTVAGNTGVVGRCCFRERLIASECCWLADDKGFPDLDSTKSVNSAGSDWRAVSGGRMDLDKFSILEDDVLGTAGPELSVVSAMHRAAGSELTSRLVDVSWREVDSAARIVIADGSSSAVPMRRGLQLAGYHAVRQVHDVHELLREMRGGHADLVLLDPESPGFSGSAVLQAAGVDPEIRGIPIVIVSHDQGPESRREALELGASDFLKKPTDVTELLPRVRNLLVVRRYYCQEVEFEERVEGEVQRRTRDLQESRDRLILCLARAAEHRDNETGNHVIRVGRYTSIIARQLGYPEDDLEMLEQAAQMHDVGKIGIPDSILFKPATLAVDEYELMKKHCAFGRQIIEPYTGRDWDLLKRHTHAGGNLLRSSSCTLLSMAARIAQSHHERWDGSGYPLGLKGEDIPLEGRIVAVADVFDALSSRRPYKPPFPRDQCFEILRDGRGRQFDPAVLDAFFECSAEIVEVQLLLMDSEDAPREASD